jgi:DnaJ family protein A protein 2
MNKAFATLGLPDTATPAEVKKKWRELCMIHHPDRGGNAVEFNGIRQAYTIAYEEASKPKACPQCTGTGKTSHAYGFNSVDLPCQLCGGSGKAQQREELK